MLTGKQVATIYKAALKRFGDDGRDVAQGAVVLALEHAERHGGLPERAMMLYFVLNSARKLGLIAYQRKDRMPKRAPPEYRVRGSGGSPDACVPSRRVSPHEDAPHDWLERVGASECPNVDVLVDARRIAQRLGEKATLVLSGIETGREVAERDGVSHQAVYDHAGRALRRVRKELRV